MNHSFLSLNTSLLLFLNPKGLEFVIILLVSSVNKTGLDLSDIILERSLILKRKYREPSIES